MKKMMAMLLMLALLVCGAAAEAADVTGTWYLNEVRMDGVTLNPSGLGMEMTMELKEGGAATISTAAGEEIVTMEGEWTQDGATVTVSVEGDPMAMVLDEAGNLVADEPETGVTMVYGRELKTFEAFDPGPVKADVTVSDFDGTWTATLVEMYGQQLSPAAMGVSIVIELKDGVGSVTQFAEDGSSTTYDVTGELADGILTITNTAEDGASSSMPLTLYESGMMSYTEIPMGVIYFEQAVEAAEAETKAA